MKSGNAVFLNLLVVCLVPAVQGAYVLNVTQNGPNVTASGSGTINTTALTGSASLTSAALVYSALGIIGVGQLAALNEWTTVSGPSGFGFGAPVSASSVSGNLVAIYASGRGIFLPQSYVSGSATSGTATWNNTTIAGLGLAPGTYTYTWGSGSSADSFTLNIGASSPSVTATPAPSSLYLAAIALAILAVWQAIRLRKVHE